MTSYDVIVLGTGGVGSAAAFHLASRGARVLGLDRFPGGHDRGSSHGQTRIIRKAYFEHPDYVPLLHRAYELWADLEARSSQQLFHRVGLIEIGPPAGVVIPGVLESARRHALPVERLDEARFAARFPGFVLPAGHQAVLEQDAGFLLVEPCVLAHLAQARRQGAELREDAAVVEWKADAGSVTVRTAAHTFRAARLVVTAGPWAATMLSDLGVGLRVIRKHLHWYACDDERYRAEGGCPGFFYETGEGYFYGFPKIDEQGVKIAEHSGGTQVADPLGDDRSVEQADRRRVEQFLAAHLPGVSRRPTQHAVCYYTLTPDEHFLVDRHPRYPHVVFAAGLSGHGFKFTSVLGEALADLALDGRTALPIEFLALRA